MSWSDFLASEFAQTVAFLGSVLTILVFIGAVIRFVYRHVRKSVLPWEAWVILLMQIGVWVVVAVYSATPWLSTVIVWAIIIMLELDSRIYQRFINQAYANSDIAIEQAGRVVKQANRVADRAVEQAEKAVGIAEEVLSVREDSSNDQGGKNNDCGERETGVGRET